MNLDMPNSYVFLGYKSQVGLIEHFESTFQDGCIMKKVAILMCWVGLLLDRLVQKGGSDLCLKRPS